MKKLKTLKRIGSLCLTLAMVFTMAVVALPAYAAGSGSISVLYNPNVELSQQTNFKLYKVGEFGHNSQGKSIIVLKDGFKDSKVNLNIAIPENEKDKQEGSEWHKNWLNAASNLENWIETPVSGKNIPDPVWTGALSKSADYQKLGDFENGIYLLTGDEQLVGEQFWSPVPVLIMVLNEETKFEIVNTDLKMATRALVHKHSVTKVWQDEDYEDGRPGSIKVGIFYGNTQIDTVELSNDNNWTYTWYSQQAGERIYTSKDPEDASSEGVETSKLNEGNKFKATLPEGDASWRVDEVEHGKYEIDENFYNRAVSYSANENVMVEQFRIANTVVTPAMHNPPVLKTIKGDEPETDEEFKFSMTAVSTTADVTEMPMPPGSEGKTKTMWAKAGTPEEFGDIIFRAPGEYVYEIREVNTGLEGYKYDDTVYTLTYELTIDGNDLHMELTTTKDGEVVEDSEYEFVNEYTGPPSDTPPGKPKTGDNGYGASLIVLIAAAAGLGGFLFYRRRKRDDAE